MSYRQYLLRSTGRFVVATAPFILAASVAAGFLNLNATGAELGLAVALPFMAFVFLGETLLRVLPEPDSTKDRAEPTRASLALGLAVMTVLVVPVAYPLYGILGIDHLLPVLWSTVGLACLPAALVLLGRFVEFGIRVTVRRTLEVRPRRLLLTPAITAQCVQARYAFPFDTLPPRHRRPGHHESAAHAA